MDGIELCDLNTFDSNSWKFLKKGVTNKTIFPRDLR